MYPGVSHRHGAMPMLMPMPMGMAGALMPSAHELIWTFLGLAGGV